MYCTQSSVLLKGRHCSTIIGHIAWCFQLRGSFSVAAAAASDLSLRCALFLQVFYKVESIDSVPADVDEMYSK